MALVNKNRVRETANNPGAGTITLSGVVVAGYQVFSVIGDGNTCYYCIQDQGGSNWEVGIGTYTLAGNTLTRTTILSSSNAGAIVTFTAGVKDVFVTYPTEKGMWLDANGNANIPNSTVLGAAAGATTTFPDLKALVVTTPSRHSIRPSLLLDFANTRQLDPRITFTRASTATYYDGQTTALAEQNLITYSEQFDNAIWVKTTTTATANSFTAPDGTVTADTLTATGTNSLVLQSFTASALPYVFSVYLYRKTGTGNIDITVDGTTYATQTITGAWVRYNIVTTPTAGTKTAGIRLAVSGDEVYIWGAQLEQRSAVTAYTPTTTAPITNYIPVLQTAASGVARFDCNPTTSESLGLLIEEQRTNLIPASGSIGNGYWNSYGSLTTVLNSSVSPDGTISATSLTGTSGTGWGTNSITPTAGTSYTASYWVKPTNVTQVRLQVVTTGVTYNQLVSAPIGVWTRVSATITAIAGDTILITRILTADANTTFVWGAQLEAGAFPTSYIPTVTSQATRIADAASMTGVNFSRWYNISEGTIYSRFAIQALQAIGNAFNINDGTTGNYIRVINNLGTISSQMAANTVNNVNISCITLVPTGTYTAIASAYKINDYYESTNGNTGVANTSNVIPTVNQLQLGIALTANSLNSTISKIAYYPKRLTNAELQGLTS